MEVTHALTRISLWPQTPVLLHRGSGGGLGHVKVLRQFGRSLLDGFVDLADLVHVPIVVGLTWTEGPSLDWCFPLQKKHGWFCPVVEVSPLSLA